MSSEIIFMEFPWTNCVNLRKKQIIDKFEGEDFTNQTFLRWVLAEIYRIDLPTTFWRSRCHRKTHVDAPKKSRKILPNRRPLSQHNVCGKHSLRDESLQLWCFWFGTYPFYQPLVYPTGDHLVAQTSAFNDATPSFEPRYWHQECFLIWKASWPDS